MWRVYRLPAGAGRAGGGGGGGGASACLGCGGSTCTWHRDAAALGAEVVPLGSAGAKVAAVLAGRAELYLHAGGMRQWDSCAPVAVALAAGLHASRIDGSPLRYNGADVDLPDLLVCRADLAGAALAAVAVADPAADPG